MMQILIAIFYQPILNLLVLIYNLVPGHDIGIAIVLMTIIIKLLLYPLSKKSIESQKSLQELQPKIEKIKKEYANDKQEMGRKMMALYASHKINPLSSCLPLLIQLPFLIGVYQVFRTGLVNGSLDLVYPFISRPESINAISFGVDLSQRNIPLALMAGAAQYWQAKMMISKRTTVKSEGAKDEDMAAIMNKQMLYFMPVLTVAIGFTLPGGLTLYWFLTTLLMGVQQIIIFRQIDRKGAGEAASPDAQTISDKVVEGEIVDDKNK